MWSPENARLSPYEMAVNLTSGAASYSPTEDISGVHLPTTLVGATLLLAEQVGSPENVRLSPYEMAVTLRREQQATPLR